MAMSFFISEFSVTDRDNSITSIGSQAFKNLPNVEVIDFSNVRIGSIGDYLFRNSYKHTDKPLILTMTADKIVNTTFDDNCFGGTDRLIQLQIKGIGNTLKLSTNYWRNFLDQNENNSINLLYFTLDCDQEFIRRLTWIKYNYDTYKKQILGICTDKMKLVDKVVEHYNGP